MDTQDFFNESTADLMQYIPWRKEEGFEQSAKDAFRVICARFERPLLEKCEIIAGKKGMSEVDALEIAQNTFKRLYKYAHAFKIDEKKDCDKSLKYYLFGIANRECTKLYCRKNGIGVSPYTGDEELLTEFPEITEDLVPDQIKRSQLLKEQEILQMALDRHSWKHQVIFLNYKFYQRDGHKMPPKLLEDLRAMLGLGQATIQAYKKEVFDTVNDYLKIYGKQ